MKVIPLITGTHTTTTTPFGVLLPGHTGAVTLLQHEGQNVLVDTGGRGIFHSLKIRLGEHGLKPRDIDFLLLTHLHLDHAYNVARFPGSRLFAWMHEWRERETLRLTDIDGYKVLGAITILKTPGHAEEHLSFVVEDETHGTTIIAGDAINEEYAESNTVKAFAYDEALYRQSADRLLEMADTIIPGHGRMFHPR